MVGIFSKVRAALFDRSRVRSYLLYAAGEVILIVLGILIAIQLDAAAERFRRPEFLALINEELTFAYSINSVMTTHVGDAKALIETLEAYLATF